MTFYVFLVAVHVFSNTDVRPYSLDMVRLKLYYTAVKSETACTELCGEWSAISYTPSQPLLQSLHWFLVEQPLVYKVAHITYKVITT